MRLKHLILSACLLLSSFAHAQLSRSDVDAEINVIKNETQPGKNTAVRVGTALRHIADNVKWITDDGYLVAGGTNNYTVDPSPALTGYTEGMGATVKFLNQATGASSISFSGLSSQAIKNLDGTDVDGVDIPAGGILKIVYNGVYFQIIGGSGGGSGTADVFTSDPTVNLTGSKTFGKYPNGAVPPWTGLTATEAITDAIHEYTNPTFTGFNVSTPAIVEVGTTLSGSKTFTWTINVGSGAVSQLDLYDNNTSTTLLTNTANDGTQAQTITTIQLNSNGATQSWKGIGHNTSPTGNFNSGNYVTTARYYYWYEALTTPPTTSAGVRVLANQAFYQGATTFILNTGSFRKFFVDLPPGVNIISVIDLDALGVDITSQYIAQTNISVIDAGGTGRVTNPYLMTISSAYSGNHRHQITVN